MAHSFFLITTLALCMGVCLTAALPLHDMHRREENPRTRLEVFRDSFTNMNLPDSEPGSDRGTKYYVCKLTSLFKLSQTMVSGL